MGELKHTFLGSFDRSKIVKLAQYIPLWYLDLGH